MVETMLPNAMYWSSISGVVGGSRRPRVSSLPGSRVCNGRACGRACSGPHAGAAADARCGACADGISPLARHDAMVALNGTALHPNDVETFDSAKTCMSGTVQEKIKCWGDTKRTTWATFHKGPVGGEFP
jgi:hypothetical protein